LEGEGRLRTDRGRRWLSRYEDWAPHLSYENLMPLRERRKRIAEDYLNFLRLKPCLLCDRLGVNPHHLIRRKWREPARDDFLSIPACPCCHCEIHTAGLASALARHGIDFRYLICAVADLLVEYFTDRDWRANAPI